MYNKGFYAIIGINVRKERTVPPYCKHTKRQKMKTTIAIAAAAAAIAACAEDANRLFDGSRWIEQPAGMNAAAPRFTTTFKVVRDGHAKVAIC